MIALWPVNELFITSATVDILLVTPCVRTRARTRARTYVTRYAKTRAERFACVDGALEFFATGSTNASWQFSPSCPGDWRPPQQEPSALNVTAMRAAAGPGAFHDADMLPIGANVSSSSSARSPPSASDPALTLPQAHSAMALWAAIPSPLMMGVDVRRIDPEYAAVWLNRGLLGVHQDPLGLQGERVRGNATECQVWRRQLKGGALYVVLYNNGRGSCNTEPPEPPAPAPAPLAWSGPCVTRVFCHVQRCSAACSECSARACVRACLPTFMHACVCTLRTSVRQFLPAYVPAHARHRYDLCYSDSDCPNAANMPGLTVAQCEAACAGRPSDCSAFNYNAAHGNGCVLRACDAAALSHPSWAVPGDVS